MPSNEIQNQGSSLWPADLLEKHVRTPVHLLREQAEQLTQKTDGMLVGKVRTQAVPETRKNPAYLLHSFEIAVPSLDNYRYQLFAVAQEPDKLYPIQLAIPADLGDIGWSTEKEFAEWLRNELASQRARDVVANLYSQAIAPATSASW